MSKEKIAFVASTLNHIKLFHLHFIKLLQDKGYELHVYGKANVEIEELKESGIIVHDINFSRSTFSIKNVRVLFKLISSFRNESFKMVHTHTPMASFIGRIAAKVTTVPLIMYTAHGFHFYKGSSLLSWLVYYPIEKVLAYFTDYLITINKEDYRLALKRLKVKKRIYYVEGVGVDLVLYSEISSVNITREYFNFSKEDIVFTYIGQLNKNKNQEQFISAMRVVVRYFANAKGLIIGRGKDRAKLEKLVKKYRLEDNIFFLGYREDIPNLILASDIIVLLSKREGLPRVLLEGLAAGKPVIATDIRGNNELVVNGKNGYLVPIKSLSKLIVYSMKLVESPSLREEMGANSREIAKDYDLNLVTKVMDNIYTNALK